LIKVFLLSFNSTKHNIIVVVGAAFLNLLEKLLCSLCCTLRSEGKKHEDLCYFSFLFSFGVCSYTSIIVVVVPNFRGSIYGAI